MKKIIVLDDGYIRHRAIFAHMVCPETHATLTFMSIIVACLKKIGVTLDDQIIMACDCGHSWRKLIDPEYKAQRAAFREGKKPPEWWTEMYGSFNNFYERIEPIMNWNFCRYNGIEADDWASMIARYFPDTECLLVSADRDWEMLAEFSNTKIFSPITKKYKLVKDPTKVLMEKIHGDKSDNLIGAPKTEKEFDTRKTVVNLLELPSHIEIPMKNILSKLTPKSLRIESVPYPVIRERIRNLYHL